LFLRRIFEQFLHRFIQGEILGGFGGTGIEDEHLFPPYQHIDKWGLKTLALVLPKYVTRLVVAKNFNGWICI
jgi:hypothetical protein